MTPSRRQPGQQQPATLFPIELMVERNFLAVVAHTALRSLEEREKDIEFLFKDVRGRDIAERGGNDLYVEVLDRSLDVVSKRLRDSEAWVDFNFAKSIGISGEMVEEEIKLTPYIFDDKSQAVRRTGLLDKSLVKKRFVAHDQSRETELELRLEHFIDRYGGNSPQNSRRRLRALNQTEEIKIPSYKEVLAIKAMKEKLSGDEVEPSQDRLFQTAQRFTGKGDFVVKLENPENFVELAEGAQQVLDGVDLLMMRNSSRSYYEYISDPARAAIEHVDLQRISKSSRPTMKELERVAKEKIVAALSNKVVRMSELFPKSVLEIEDINEAYAAWEDIFAVAGNVEKEGLREAARQITEQHKREIARRRVPEKIA